MKKIFAICCIAASVLAAVSCEKPVDGYTGTNYIYLTAAANSMYDTADDELDLNVQLTTALDADLKLTLKVVDDDLEIITLEGNPLTIKAGEKTGKVTIRTKELNEIERNFVITLDTDEAALPENVVLKDNFTFTVITAAVPELTEEQKSIVKAYYDATGIDLNKYLGLVDVTTVYTASNGDSDVPNDPVTLTGKTKIILSDESTEEQPVLKMTVNPMGLKDELYRKLKESTVTSPYWIDENAYQSYAMLMEAIGWNDKSVETFTMTLGGIKLNSDKTIDFVSDLSYYDAEYEEDVTLFKVDFQYEFSAYEREKAALEAGKIGVAVDEFWAEDATANPQHWINSEDISEDLYESGNYVEYSAAISPEYMTFTFPIYNTNDYDYSKVAVSYTPKKN